MQKLGLSEYQSQTFARFLIEERDEANMDAKTIYDPIKKIDSQLVIVRIMTSSNCPTIFDDKREEETKIKFIKVFQERHQQLI